MRTISTATAAILASKDRTSHVRVYVDRDGAGTFVDLTSYLGVDWVDSVEWDENVDAITNVATVTLRKQDALRTSSPLMEGSQVNDDDGTYTPLVDVSRAIYIQVAVTPQGWTPASGDWVEVFRGVIDAIDIDSMTLHCRDKSYLLVDTFIEVERIYGDLTGVDVEDVIQSLLDDNLGTGVVTLYSVTGDGTPAFDSADSPGFAILQYWQQQQSLAEAIDALVRQFGWVVRYQWHTPTSAFQLVLSEPDRAKTTPDHTFGPDDYYAINRLSISRAAIRNVIEVAYTDASDGQRRAVKTVDTTSVTRYGRLYMKVGEASSSQIDSSAEATAFVAAILGDLKDPGIEQEATQDLFWPAALGDLYRYEANGVHYDTDQDLAVVSARHSLRGGVGRTVLGVRGSPSGGYRRWRRLDKGMQSEIGIGAVGPGQIDSNTSGGLNAVPNPEFGAQSRDIELYLPDGWENVSYPTFSYVSGGALYYSTTCLTAGRSVRMSSSGPVGGVYPTIESMTFPVTEGLTYTLGATARVDTITGDAAYALHTQVWWFDYTKTFITSNVYTHTFTAANTWQTLTQTVVAPAGARFARFRVRHNAASVASVMLVDRVILKL